MQKSIFDPIIERRNSDSVKWRQYDQDVLPMWVADMDFKAPATVIDALRTRLDQGIFGYSIKYEDLIDEICAWLVERYGWQVSPPEVILLPGVITGFNLACHACSAPGEGVLLQTPVYPPIWHAPEVTNRSRQAMELLQSPGGYQVDFDAFEQAVTPHSRLFILCNPHNPVGRVFCRAELERMADICLRHNLIICSDEIHSELVYPGSSHLPIASISPDISRSVITLMAPSKTFNIPGLECSFAVIQNPDLRRQYLQAFQGLVPGVNILGAAAALAAYRTGKDWLKDLLQYLESNRDYLYNIVQRDLPAIRMEKPEGTYLAWLDCRQAGITGSPGKFFLEQARLALNDGSSFGPGGDGFVRLNFGCPRSLLEEAVRRLKTALKTL